MGKRLGALFAVLTIAAATWALAPAAGAQTTVFSCSYSVNPTTLPPTGGVVTISGIAPGTSTVRVFVNGVLAATTVSAPVTGAFSAQVSITASAEVSVALDGYPTTPCIGVGGESVDQDGNPSGSIVVAGAGVTRTRLPTTGASDTKPFALMGLGAICLGLVLVVAARRRSHVHGRD